MNEKNSSDTSNKQSFNSSNINQNKINIPQKPEENKMFSNGVLDKLKTLREQNMSTHVINKANVAIIKASNDLDIDNLVRKIINTKNLNNNIGVRKTIKILSSDIKVNFISIYDYNYTIINKYVYLKKEIMKNCDNYVVICNIFDKGLELFFKDFIEMIKNSNDSSKKKINFLLISSTNNFLMSMVAPEQLITIKQQISSLFNSFKYKFFNLENNEINVNKFLLEVIN